MNLRLHDQRESVAIHKLAFTVYSIKNNRLTLNNVPSLTLYILIFASTPPTHISGLPDVGSLAQVQQQSEEASYLFVNKISRIMYQEDSHRHLV